MALEPFCQRRSVHFLLQHLFQGGLPQAWKKASPFLPKGLPSYDINIVYALLPLRHHRHQLDNDHILPPIALAMRLFSKIIGCISRIFVIIMNCILASFFIKSVSKFLVL